MGQESPIQLQAQQLRPIQNQIKELQNQMAKLQAPPKRQGQGKYHLQSTSYKL